MIKFERRKLKTKLRSPILDFKIDEQEIELRKDPLTKRWCRININRIKRGKPGLEENGEAIREVIRSSRKDCPFCQDAIDKSTSKFVKPPGRMKVGESVLFPNIFPYSMYHSVVLFTAKRHFIDLNEMGPKLLFNTLKNCLNFFKTSNKERPEFKYPSINFNFMPPAGASMIHPHLQVVMDDQPTFMTDLLIKKSLDYYQKEDENFWSGLVKAEKRKGERFIGESGSFSWIADFAPIKNNSISGIIRKKVSSLTDLKREGLKDISEGLSEIFKKMWGKGVRSLCMAVFSGPVDEDISDYYRVNVKIVSRPRLTEKYASDIGFMELLHQESVVETLPEEVAKSLKFGE